MQGFCELRAHRTDAYWCGRPSVGGRWRRQDQSHRSDADLDRASLPGARKFKFLRHEIFEWLVENRYRPGDDDYACYFDTTSSRGIEPIPASIC
jgi:hypothetical protein